MYKLALSSKNNALVSGMKKDRPFFTEVGVSLTSFIYCEWLIAKQQEDWTTNTFFNIDVPHNVNKFEVQKLFLYGRKYNIC